MSFVYRFLNEQNEIIYVGRTNNIHHRIGSQHFKKHGHLTDACYEECKYVDYAELVSENDSKIYEIYLIDKYSPKYNITLTTGGAVSLDLPELSWVRTERDVPAKEVVTFNIDEFNEKLEFHLAQIEHNTKTLEYLDFAPLRSKRVDTREKRINNLIKQVDYLKSNTLKHINIIRELQKFYLMNQEIIDGNKRKHVAPHQKTI